jgi:transcriptional regulator with XRE-family HTH domain
MNGSELHKARSQLGISQTDLARILVVAVSTIHRWEHAKDARFDPLQRELVGILVTISAKSNGWLYGRMLLAGLARGPTYALHVLLAIGYDEVHLIEQWRSDNVHEPPATPEP